MKDAVLQQTYTLTLWSESKWNVSDTHNGIVPGNGKIHKIKAPFWVFAGEKDLLCNYKETMLYQEILGKEQVQMKIWPDSGHATIEDHFEEISD